MNIIFKIFKKDIKNLMRNILALIIAIGLCIIPSLYAWFNIYSNWDPYANTSSLKIAVATCDTGYTGTDNSNVNMGDKIIDQLHDNKNIGWLLNLLMEGDKEYVTVRMRHLTEYIVENIMQPL